jgi:hypothetical protein
MPGKLARQSVLAMALVAGAAVAEARPCDEPSRRAHGQAPRALRTLWQELDVRSTLFADDAAGPLQVRRRDLARPGAQPSVVVLTVTDRAEVDWQHLVFAEARATCRFMGAIDAPAQGVAPPSPRLLALPEAQAAVVVQAKVRGGTDLDLHRESWHLVTGDRLVRVLDYPARGHLIGWPSTFDRVFTTRAEAVGAGDAVSALRVEFTASYTSGSYIHWMPVEPLFTAARTAHYRWKPAERRFVLDPARSDVDDEEIEGIFQDAEEQFLQHNVQDLIQLAARANERQRAWLLHFLDAVADGPEKRAVMQGIR